MIFVAAVALALQTAPTFDADAFVRDHQEELKRELQRQREIKSFSDDQALIVYDQCLSKEAASLSYTSLLDEQVFGYARQRCLALKIELLNGAQTARFVRFKALDDAKAGSFPTLTKQIRERRRASDTQTGKSTIAPN